MPPKWEFDIDWCYTGESYTEKSIPVPLIGREKKDTEFSTLQFARTIDKPSTWSIAQVFVKQSNMHIWEFRQLPCVGGCETYRDGYCCGDSIIQSIMTKGGLKNSYDALWECA